MQRVANADATHDADRSFIMAHFEKSEMKEVSIQNYSQKYCSDIASINIELELQSDVSGD